MIFPGYLPKLLVKHKSSKSTKYHLFFSENREISGWDHVFLWYSLAPDIIAACGISPEASGNIF